MDKLQEMIAELIEIANHPGRSVANTINETGKKAVGCFPIYAPEEIVYAAGAVPIGMWGGPLTGHLADKYLQSFCCSVMKANTEQALSGQYGMLSAVIMTTYCDTLKCIVENWKVASPELNIIPMVYPQNRKIDAGKVFLKEELIRVKTELEKFLDVEITEASLEKSVELYEEYRNTMRKFVKAAGLHTEVFDAVTRHLVIKAAYFMDKKIYTEKMKKILAEVDRLPVTKFTGKKVILTGLLAEPSEFLSLLTENNLAVVADDLAQESRQFRVAASKEGDVFDRMVSRIAMQDGCAFLYDEDKSRGKMLIDMKKETGADAIIVCQMKFCDPEEFDYPILKKEFKEASIQELYLEIEQQMGSVEQLRTRIQSFAEMLD